MSDSPVVFHGSSTPLANNVAPTPHPSKVVRRHAELSKETEVIPAVLRIANGPKGMTDAGVVNPAATHVIQTRQPVALDVGAVIAHPQGFPLTTRPPSPIE
jgi:hypothetical protein